MQIKNLTKKTIIVKKSVFIEDIFSKSIGLMFSKKQDRGLIFRFNKEKIISLHMFFVFYPIDVLFIDENKTVAEIKKNFRPFAFYKPKKKAMYVVELPDGIIKKSKTELGDKIQF